MSSERLARLVEFGALNDMDSVLVTRHGRIVLEATYAPFRAGLKHHVYSATKSVTSTLVGMALGDGLLDSTDRRVVDFFPGRTIANLDDAKKAITVHQLLDMTSGLAWSEGLTGAIDSPIAMARSPDWQQFVLDQPMATAPGTRFYYNSGNSHLLSAILSKVTGRSANDYAREKLFGPLGIDDVLWQADPQGVSVGGCGLYLQPRDMAKIGYLWLRGGLWEGRQILPAAWIEGVRAADVDMRESWASDLRYGRQFWVDAGPRHLHGGRQTPPAHRRDAQARHRGGGDRLAALHRPEQQRGQHAALRLRDAGGLPRRRRDLRRRRRGRSRGDGRARRAGEGGRHRAAGAGQRQYRHQRPPAMAKAVSGKTWRFATAIRCASSPSP